MTQMIDIDSIVERAAGLVADHVRLDDDELVALLRARGFDSELAERLVAFLPLAFGRAIFNEDAPVFADHYDLPDPRTDAPVSFPLVGEPVFVASAKLANRWFATGSAERVRAIAVRSAEVSVVDQLVRDGSRPSACALTAPLLLRLAFPHRTPPRRWWRFW